MAYKQSLSKQLRVRVGVGVRVGVRVRVRVGVRVGVRHNTYDMIFLISSLLRIYSFSL